jgi:hypothetical protein
LYVRTQHDELVEAMTIDWYSKAARFPKWVNAALSLMQRVIGNELARLKLISVLRNATIEVQ